MSKYLKIIGVVSLGILIILLYSNVISKMVFDWKNDPNYSHGFIIPFVSLFLVWKKRTALIKLERKSNIGGLLILILGLLLYFLGNVANELFLQRMSMIVVFAGVICWNLSWGHLRVLLFPLIFLVFMIPLPYLLYDSIAFPLQLIVSRFSVNLLHIFQIPALREGNIIYLASTTLQVEEACSGIRSLVSLLALTSIYAFLVEEGSFRKAILIATAFPIAIAVNVMRVTTTGVLVVFFGEKAAQGMIHESLGWGVFVVAFILVVAASKIISFCCRRSPKR